MSTEGNNVRELQLFGRRIRLGEQGEILTTPNPEQPSLLNVTPNALHSEPVYYEFLELRSDHISSFPVAPAAAQGTTTMNVLGSGNGNGSNYLPVSNLAEQHHHSSVMQQPIVLTPQDSQQNYSLGAETWTPAPFFPDTQGTLMQHPYPQFSDDMWNSANYEEMLPSNYLYPGGGWPSSYYYGYDDDYLVYDPRYLELGLPIDPYLRNYMSWRSTYELSAAIDSAQDLLDRLQ